MLTFAPHYVLWHYTTGFWALFHIWWNFIWVTGHFFGIANLAQSLFAPWKRVTETPRRKWDFEAVAGAMVVNLMSRLIGFLLRLTLIFIGVIALLLVMTLGVGVMVLWLCAPFLILFCLGYGAYLITTSFYAYTL